MANIEMEEQKEFVVFPAESLLLLRITESVTEDIPARGSRDAWTALRCKFKIMQVLTIGNNPDPNVVAQFNEMVGEEIRGSVAWRLTTHPENKLRQWAEAIFETQLPVGFNLDSNAFVGRVVKGYTKTYERKSNGQVMIDPQTGQPKLGHEIDMLIPAQGLSQALGTPQQQAMVAGQAPPAGWTPPQQPQGAQQGWGQQAPAAQNGWATPGVPPQAPPPPAQHQAPPQEQWAPQQNLQQQDQQWQQQPVQQQPVQPPQQQAPPPQAQAPAQAPPQGFAQQQVQNYTQPAQQQGQQQTQNDPWAPPHDPTEPDF